jgi:hypothetical protein
MYSFKENYRLIIIPAAEREQYLLPVEKNIPLVC